MSAADLAAPRIVAESNPYQYTSNMDAVPNQMSPAGSDFAPSAFTPNSVSPDSASDQTNQSPVVSFVSEASDLQIGDLAIPSQYFYEYYSHLEVNPEEQTLNPATIVVQKAAQHLSAYVNASQQDMYTHLCSLYNIFQLDEEIFLTAIITLYRYMGALGSTLVIQSLSELFYLLILCLLISMKGVLDIPVNTKSIAKELNLDPERLFFNEHQILVSLGYSLFFKGDDLSIPDEEAAEIKAQEIECQTNGQPLPNRRRGSLAEVFPIEGLLCLSYSSEKPQSPAVLTRYCEDYGITPQPIAPTSSHQLEDSLQQTDADPVNSLTPAVNTVSPASSAICDPESSAPNADPAQTELIYVPSVNQVNQPSSNLVVLCESTAVEQNHTSINRAQTEVVGLVMENPRDEKPLLKQLMSDLKIRAEQAQLYDKTIKYIHPEIPVCGQHPILHAASSQVGPLAQNPGFFAAIPVQQPLSQKMDCSVPSQMANGAFLIAYAANPFVCAAAASSYGSQGFQGQSLYVAAGYSSCLTSFKTCVSNQLQFSFGNVPVYALAG